MVGFTLVELRREWVISFCFNKFCFELHNWCCPNNFHVHVKKPIKKRLEMKTENKMRKTAKEWLSEFPASTAFTSCFAWSVSFSPIATVAFHRLGPFCRLAALIERFKSQTGEWFDIRTDAEPADIIRQNSIGLDFFFCHFFTIKRDQANRIHLFKPFEAKRSVYLILNRLKRKGFTGIRFLSSFWH